jgi:hypothetical protein
MNESPEVLTLLSSRVDELEKRIDALEHPQEARPGLSVPRVTFVPMGTVAGEDTSGLETGNVFPTIGRAMLGIAGAYVLRAIAETGVLPKLPVTALAIAYAFAWLLWSSRASVALTRVVYAGTSAVILAPMLWENTLTFHLLSPVVAAGVLAAFLTLATVLNTNADAHRMWIAQGLAIMTAAALAFATHHVLPFFTAMLIGTFVIDLARLLNYPQPAWPWIALISDGVAWGMVFIYAGPENARTAYPDLSTAELIAPGCMLFAICAIGVAWRAIRRSEKITVFDAVQTMIAFLAAASGVLYLVLQPGRVVLGVVCLLLSVGMYLATFKRLNQLQDRRNARIFGAWGAALLIVGSLWALPHHGASVVLSIASVAAFVFARRKEPAILTLHGVLLLAVGTTISGIPQYVFDAVAGSLRRAPAISIVVVALCSGIAVLALKQTAERAGERMLQLLPALIAICALIALLVHAVLAAVAVVVPIDAHHIAFLRTLTICVAALIMAFSGSRWKRAGITHLAYFVLAFVAAKLLFEDLRLGHMEYIAGSIALFAVALIAAPRLVRLGTRLHAAVHLENLAQGDRLT